MILAFVGEFDNSSKNVVDWLKKIDSNVHLVALRDCDVLYPVNVELSNNSNYEELINICSDQVTFYYYRRGKFRTCFSPLNTRT